MGTPQLRAIEDPGEKWNAIKEAYLAQLYSISESVRSRDEYRYVLERFLARYPDPSRLGPGDVRLWIYAVGVRGRPVSASAMAMRYHALRGMLGLALQLGEVDRNATDLVPKPRGNRKGPHGLNPADFEHVLRACPDTPDGREERAILTVAVLTALRRAELLRLSGETMQWRPAVEGEGGAWWYRVRRKGGGEAHAELNPAAVAAIEAMLADRGCSLDSLGSRAVFPMSACGLWRRVRRAGERVRIRLSPHMCKHSAAIAGARALEAGQLSLFDLQEFLWHSSPAQLATYLRGLTGRPARASRAVGAALGLGKPV